MAKFTTGIEHVIVLCLENRSYDHMLGFLKMPNGTPLPHGLTGNELNLENPAVPGSAKVVVSNDAQYTGDLDVDPSHEVTHVNVQLFGVNPPPPPGGATNIGFVLDYATQGPPNPHTIMKCFDPSKLPVLTQLASEFVLCDRWHSSVPGQTWPNRFFLHCASSGGFVDNQVRHYGMRTIYENITGAGLDWGIYFHDFPQSLTLANLTDSAFKDKFKFFPDFFRDLKGGTLPNYCFLEPRYFDFLSWKANDQHPPHDVQLGEHLIADVYEQLRASSYWAKSLFVLLYDEHGGIYDHVLPPPTVNPDPTNQQVSLDPPFDFTRLGLRVPAVIVSPFIKTPAPGTIGVDSTVYDHSSLLATVRELFNLSKPLTNRDAHAATFTHLLVNDPARPAPTTLQRPPDPLGNQFHSDPGAATMTADKVVAQKEAGMASPDPLSEFQESIVAIANKLDVPESAKMRVLRLARAIDDEHDAAVHVREIATKFVENV